MEIQHSRFTTNRKTTQPVANNKALQTAKTGPTDTVRIESSFLNDAKSLAGEWGTTVVGATALFAGGGALVGSMFGAPGTGAVKGLAYLGMMTAASAVMENPKFESAIFNWSKTMPGDRATPRNLPDTTRNNILFKANLATNALVLSGLGAAGGALLAGTPGAIVGGGLVLVGGAFAELLMG